MSVLRSNRNFRLLYIGQTISQLGDWFNAVAVYALLLGAWPSMGLNVVWALIGLMMLRQISARKKVPA